jgi:hypothetical protein
MWILITAHEFTLGIRSLSVHNSEFLVLLQLDYISFYNLHATPLNFILLGTPEFWWNI